MFCKKNVTNICLLFPILFLFELILGYSGKMVTVCSVPIRTILFALSFFSLYFCLFCYLRKNKIKFLALNDKKSFLGSFNLVDDAMLLLLFSVAIFSTVIPAVVGTDLKMAAREVLSPFLVMTLFFPISYFIKSKIIDLKKIEQIVYYLVFFLACIHIFLYVGQIFNSRFIENYFLFLKSLFFNTSILPPIMLGHLGAPRVFFPNSVWLVVGIYIFLKNLNKIKLKDYAIFFVDVAAVLTTMTKSMWLGLEVGFIVFSACYLLTQLQHKNSKNALKIISLFLGTFLFIFTLNLTVFDNAINEHFSSTFANSEYDFSEYLRKDSKSCLTENVKDSYKRDREGSIVSNDIKIRQMRALLRRWRKSPLVGFGYGSYIKTLVRSHDFPFSYEMTAFALLMKTGVLGMIFWIFLIIALIFVKFNNSKRNLEDFFSWLFLAISFGILVQTNPLLFNSVGMALLLFISFETIDDSDKKIKENCENVA